MRPTPEPVSATRKGLGNAAPAYRKVTSAKLGPKGGREYTARPRGHGPVSVVGGLSRNAYVVQFHSEVAGVDLRLLDENEKTAAGLVRMAAEAVGLDIPGPQPDRHLTSTHQNRPVRIARFATAAHADATFASQTAGQAA